jgi:Spy/CpxP family protein refolding chaperone
MIRIMGPGLLAVLAAVGVCGGQVQSDDKPEPPKERIKLLENFAKLITPEIEEKLKLSDEQKKKIDKIVEEFEADHKEDLARIRKNFMRIREDIEKAVTDMDKEAIRKLFLDLARQVAVFERLRDDLDGRLKDVLTDEQKKMLVELRKEARNALLFGKKSEDKKPDDKKPEEKKPDPDKKPNDR